MKYPHDIFWIVLIIVVFFVFAVFEPSVFNYFPPQISGDITIEQWKVSFRIWALVVVSVAGGASVLWYVRAQWVFKINNPQAAGKRRIWVLFSLFPIISVIVAGILFTGRAESVFIWPFFALNGSLYFFATYLFSPSSFKYAPPLASRIRPW